MTNADISLILTCDVTFLPICAQKCDHFSIIMTRYDALNNFSFDLKSLAKKLKELEVFSKITLMMSRDRKFVGVARKWHHAVYILFTIFFLFT